MCGGGGGSKKAAPVTPVPNPADIEAANRSQAAATEAANRANAANIISTTTDQQPASFGAELAASR